MVKLRWVLLLVLPISSVCSSTADDSERVIWNKQPIPVVLAVGKERLIHFSGEIRYWIPETLETAVSVMAANGVLYIQSNHTFVKTRMRVQDTTTQRVYLLDLVGQETGQYPQNILITHPSQVKNLSQSENPTPTKVDWPIRLMRFAAQTLYAPQRLSPADPHIRRIAVNAEPIRLLRGGTTEAVPLAQWQGGGWYVTAVLVRNLTNQTLEIAPVKRLPAALDVPPKGETDTSSERDRTLYLSEAVRGAWLHAAAQHNVLSPAGDDADRTCLYLVSNRPFAEAR